VPGSLRQDAAQGFAGTAARICRLFHTNSFRALTMINRNQVRLSKLALGLALALATATPAFAQSTSSGVGGQVTDASGAPVAGADVTITHRESGTVSHTTTDASGRYNARGLRVGGPYSITVDKAGAGTDTEDGIFLNLNQVTTVDAKLHSGAVSATLGTVVVAGTANSVFSSDNKGVGTNISGRALETAVSGNRSLDDIARLDPRITVTDQSDGSISVSGQNNRYNNISVDGLSVTDPFGLNANGLGFTGSPISPDTIAAYDIKITDYDITSDAVGANINAVTKSGTNEFHGSVYEALTNGSNMVGDRPGSDFTVFDQNKTLGFTLGGPIIKDKLFFFLSYEDQKVDGIAGVGRDALSTNLLTQAQLDAVSTAFEGIGIQTGTGGGGSGLTLESKRTLAKLDWNISDDQRASFTFQRTEESRPSPYSGYVKDNSVILPSNFYTSANNTDNYSFQLFSDWTDSFSTELKIGYQKYDNTNGAAIDQPEVFACFSTVICSNNPTSIGSSTPWVIAGEDRFRHENSIASKRISGTLAGTYYAGAHTIKGGFDFLSNETADVFGQLLHGSYGFYDKNKNGTPADEIAAGDYGTFVKNYLPDGVGLADAGGTWKYTQLSPFLQDTWQATDNLSLVFGVRVNIPKSDHAPPVALESSTTTAPGATAGAPVWESRFGYPSNTTLGSKNKVIEPRFAFNYKFDTAHQMQLRGGVGLFQTVPPTVWLSNPYVNNGYVSAKQYTGTDPVADPFSADPYNQPGPTSVPAGVCAPSFAGSCQIDVLDPDFKLPSAWKSSLALDAELLWGLTGSIEYTHIQAKDAIAYLLPNLGIPNGKLPDGRDSYWKTFPTPGAGVGSSANNGAFPEINTRSSLLTNTDKGHSDSVTFALADTMKNGFSGNASVTFTHATEINPGTSSQAYSNYNFVARTNPNELIEANSRFDIPLSAKLSLNWDHAFFGDYRTTLSAYYNGHSGQPYSWVFGGNDVNGDAVATSVDLAYIPLINDPIVTYKSGTSPEQIAAFQARISNDRYLNSHRGQIAERNAMHQPWINQLDVGFQQELPGFIKGNKFVARLDIYNFLNMLNKDWGEQSGVGFFGSRNLVNVSDVTNGKYVYDLTTTQGSATVSTFQDYAVRDSSTNPGRVVSRWQALFTLKYEF
jgi:outer membrane receptor for ferrienterochelin and colicin